MSEKLCLQWNDFRANVHSAFGKLRDDKEFTDVTLACEDGQPVEAHQVVLAASSPFFEKVLKINKHPHPLIFFRGFQSEDLAAILNFLYFGEAIIHKENLDSFLAAAEELKLEGLTGQNSSTFFGEEHKPTNPEPVKESSNVATASLFIPNLSDDYLQVLDQKVKSFERKK